MSTKTQQRYRLVHDNDGHDYIIEAGVEGYFYAWVESMENNGDSKYDFEDCRVSNSGWTFADPQGYL